MEELVQDHTANQRQHQASTLPPEAPPPTPAFPSPLFIGSAALLQSSLGKESWGTACLKREHSAFIRE